MISSDSDSVIKPQAHDTPRSDRSTTKKEEGSACAESKIRGRERDSPGVEKGALKKPKGMDESPPKSSSARSSSDGAPLLPIIPTSPEPAVPTAAAPVLDDTHDYGSEVHGDPEGTLDYGPATDAALDETRDYNPEGGATLEYPENGATGATQQDDSATREILEDDLYTTIYLSSGHTSAR